MTPRLKDVHRKTIKPCWNSYGNQKRKEENGNEYIKRTHEEN